ncbi:NmrA family transcriptional regulator [Methylopila turkensis]|uniref:NmrA family transcriptional regulator n=2 Tax=Methylopila turkensis TaxID=1437816 RepID=A0A9W6JK70_9HYPH|nr:NmrA family transcriptional regulator [Methylopila turkensis]
MNASKKIVVMGGTGLIGSRTVALLRAAGHEVMAASPSTGVDAFTGEGLADALRGADAVVDVTNLPSSDPAAVMSFFRTSTENLMAAEAAAGVRVHILLSIVGADRLRGNFHLDAKVVQEELVRQSGQPHTIVRATQFFEFLGALADGSTVDGAVRLAKCQFQPIAADEVAAALAGAATADAINGVIEIAGPERAGFAEIVGRYLRAVGDPRAVEADADVGYFGGRVSDLSLVPLGEARLGRTDLDGWLQSRKSAA